MNIKFMRMKRGFNKLKDKKNIFKDGRERRALLLALALTLPLLLYGVPYAYAAQTSSSYTVESTIAVAASSTGAKL